MFRPPSKRREGRFCCGFRLFRVKSSMSAPDPEDLRALGQRLDELQTRHRARPKEPAPGPLNIAFRFATEMVASLIVGGGLGWGIDWLFGHFGIHTRPVFLIVFFALGATAGIRNVTRAAAEINAKIAQAEDRQRSDEEK
jgi:ATP synthase protein I